MQDLHLVISLSPVPLELKQARGCSHCWWTFCLHDIPYDGMWVDIKHIRRKKQVFSFHIFYIFNCIILNGTSFFVSVFRDFTWGPLKFPDSLEMAQNFTTESCRFITIVNQHETRRILIFPLALWTKWFLCQLIVIPSYFVTISLPAIDQYYLSQINCYLD
jgi:hypothetical protein